MHLTRLELVIGVLVLGFLFVLALWAFGAGDPRVRSDERRRHDLQSMLDGLYNYAIAHHGNFPVPLPTEDPREICAFAGRRCHGSVDLSVLAGSGGTLPRDPLATGTGTAYTIVLDRGRITLCAPKTEAQDEEICLTQ